MKAALLLLSLCLVCHLSVSEAASPCFSTGEGSWWTFFVNNSCEFASSCVETGTKVYYTYDSSHDVWTMQDDDDFDNCNL